MHNAPETNQNSNTASSKFLAGLSGVLGVFSLWAMIGTGIAIVKKNAFAQFWGSENKISVGAIYTLVTGALAIVVGKMSSKVEKRITPLPLEERNADLIETNIIPKKTDYKFSHSDKLKEPNQSYAEQVQSSSQVTEIAK